MLPLGQIWHIDLAKYDKIQTSYIFFYIFIHYLSLITRQQLG